MEKSYDRYFGRQGIVFSQKDTVFEEQKERCVNKFVFQEYRKAFLSEIEQIAVVFDEQKIVYAVMKGFPLYDDLYRGNNRRISSDIDILVDKDDLYRSIKALEGIGYVYGEINDISQEEVDRDWHLTMGQQHVEPLVKVLNKNIFYKRSVVELHYVVAPTYYSDFGIKCEENVLDTKAMLARRVESECCGRRICRLNRTDEFEMLILHYCAHLFISCRRAIRLYSRVDVEPKLLIDIAEYWSGFSNFIEMELVYLDLRNKHRVSWLLLVSHMLEDIFGISILENVDFQNTDDTYIEGQDTFRQTVYSLSKRPTRELVTDFRGVIKSEFHDMLKNNIMCPDAQGNWSFDLHILYGFKYNQRVIRTIHQSVNAHEENDSIRIQFNMDDIGEIIRDLQSRHSCDLVAKDIGEPGIYVTINGSIASDDYIEKTYNIFENKNITYIHVLGRFGFEECQPTDATIEISMDHEAIVEIKNIRSLAERNGIIIRIYVSVNAPYYHLSAY